MLGRLLNESERVRCAGPSDHPMRSAYALTFDIYGVYGILARVS